MRVRQPRTGGRPERASGVPGLTFRNRPLIVGSSIGTRHGPVGSIGAFARREGRLGFFTSPDSVGARFSNDIGESVFQPGAVGGTGLSERTRVGTIGGVVIQRLDDGASCYGAFVELFAGVGVDPDLPTTVGPWRSFTGLSSPKQIAVGMPAAKLGCATGLTFGEVTAVEMSLQIARSAKEQPIQFNGVIEITAKFEDFSSPGDGGAVVFDPINGKVLGLLVAGTDGAEAHTYALPLSPTLDALGIELEFALA